MRHLLAEQFTPTDVGMSVEEVRNGNREGFGKVGVSIFTPHGPPTGSDLCKRSKVFLRGYSLSWHFQQHLEADEVTVIGPLG